HLHLQHHISHLTLPTALTFYFFVSGCDRLRDLHSFPTRRSSDLWNHFHQVAEIHTGRPKVVCQSCLTLLDHPHHKSNGTSAMGRSEEHTSELQSRFDLVCRLLLEKKKTTTTISPASIVCATNIIL